MLFYPVEKYLSKYTDCLITINSEDCELAHKKKFRAGKIYKVHGVGVELDKFKAVDADERRVSEPNTATAATHLL